MKRLTALLLAAVCIAVCACKKVEEEQTEVENKVETQENAEQLENAENVPAEDNPVQEAQDVFDIDKTVTELGAVISGEETPFYSDADAFSSAIVSKDTGVISQYTGGADAFYDCLSGVAIKSYKLYPFTFSDDVLETMMTSWKYPAATAHYFVEFEVTSSDREEFPVGRTVYYMGFSEYSAMGNKLVLFVPAKEAEQHMFEIYAADETENYLEAFVSEFVSGCYGMLADGRNYPDAFTFTENVHFVSHLMARSGRYGGLPPYTLEEINDFVVSSFDGNDGVDSTELDYMVWLHDIVLEEIPPDDRMFGCSAAHGLAIVEHQITGKETDGNSRIYTVEIYADYAHFAPASTIVFYFDVNEGALPKLTLVDLRQNTAREPAVTAV